MKNYDYEKDEVIRSSKKKAKAKPAKSKHKHEYKEVFVPKDGQGLNLDRTDMVCSICGKVGQTLYHWRMFGSR